MNLEKIALAQIVPKEGCAAKVMASAFRRILQQVKFPAAYLVLLVKGRGGYRG